MGIYLDLIRKCKIFVADPDEGRPNIQQNAEYCVKMRMLNWKESQKSMMNCFKSQEVHYLGESKSRVYLENEFNADLDKRIRDEFTKK